MKEFKIGDLIRCVGTSPVMEDEDDQVPDKFIGRVGKVKAAYKHNDDLMEYDVYFKELDDNVILFSDEIKEVLQLKNFIKDNEFKV